MKSKNLFIAGALALSTVMTPVASMLNAIPVMAENVNVTVTIQASGDGELLEGHTFKAVQIFKGDIIDDGKALSNIEWADSSKGTQILNALKNEENKVNTIFESCNTAQEVANALAANSSDESVKEAFIKVVYGILKDENGIQLNSGNNMMDAGYYLIIDTTSDSEVVNKALLQVSRDVEIQPKTEAGPTIEKTVKEDSDNFFHNAADYGTEEIIEFQFEATIPGNIGEFDDYTYTIHDQMSDGLVYYEDDNHTISAKIVDADGTTVLSLTNGTDFEVTKPGDPIKQFDIEFKDLERKSEDIAGKKMIVAFYGKLDRNSETLNIGESGNINKVYLTYSNDINDSSKTKNTPTDQVVVFTYELDATKVDADNTSKTLAGAEFKLRNEEDQWAQIDENSRLTGWGTEENASTLSSDNDGNFNIIGLDAGVYYLKETKAPSGYNGLNKEFVVKITATKDEDWSSESAETALKSLEAIVYDADNVNSEGNANEGAATQATINKSTGKVAVNIANGKGPELPTTGGMGTTMLYVGGSALVGIAAVLYVTNKRMKKEEE